MIELEASNYLGLRLFDIRSDLLDIHWDPIITGYSVLQSFGREFQTSLIVSDYPSSYYRIFLSGLISLQLGSKRCLRCFTELPVSSSDLYCSSCYSLEEHSYRMCLFHSPKKVFSAECNPQSPPCGILANVSKCFSKYYLYFGRFGNSIKVGISKLYQNQLKYLRLAQQGLNEAIVVYPFNSLAQVTNFERFLIDDIGVQESFSFAEKVDNLLSYCNTKLCDYYSLEQIRELFPSRKVIHLDLYPDNPLETILSSSFDIQIDPYPAEIRGNILYTQGNVCVVKQYNCLIFLDLSKLVGRTLGEEEKW